MKNGIEVAQKMSHMRVTETMRALHPDIPQGKGPEFLVTVFVSKTGKTYKVEAVCQNNGRARSQIFRGKYADRYLRTFLKEYNLCLEQGPNKGDYFLRQLVYCPFNEAADRLDSLAHEMYKILPKKHAEDLENTLNKMAVDLRANG